MAKKNQFLEEIKVLSAEQLRSKVSEFAEEMMKLRFRAAGGQLQQGHRIRELRRNIARAKTVMTAQQAS